MSQRNVGVYILFRADTAQAKAGATEVKGAVEGVTAATDRQADAAARNTAAKQAEARAARELAEAERQARDAAVAAVLGSTPAGARQAAINAAAPLVQPAAVAAAPAAGFEALDAAIRTAAGSSDRLQAAIARTTTAFGPAQTAVARMTGSLRVQTAALIEEGRASAAWRDRQDAIRAQFNPLFAASKQYEMQLRAIAAAERESAITAGEAVAARERAAAAMAPAAGPAASAAKQTTHYAGQLTYQFSDVAMMAALGQSPMMLTLQQGPQVAQVLGDMRRQGLALGPAIAGAFTSMLNPMTMATMGIIAFSAVGVQGLMKLKGETKSFADHLEDLDATIGRMKTNLDRLGNTRLGETFGDLKSEAQELARLMVQIDREGEIKSISGLASNLQKDTAKPSLWQELSQGTAAGFAPMPAQSIDDYLKNRPARTDNYKALGAANTYDDFVSRTAAIEQLAKSGDIKGVVADLLALKSAMTADGSVTGMSKELRKLLGDLADAAFKTAELEAAWNGTAKAKVIGRQVGQMERDWTQQAELSRVIALYGQQSAEAEATRATHARAALEAQLEEMGVAGESDEARRARAALEEKLAADREAAEAARIKAEQALLDDLARQEELSTAILKHGEDSAEVEAVKADHARQALRTRLEEAHMLPGLVDLAVRLTDAEQRRVAAIKAAAGARSADRMMAELRDQAAINAAKVAHGENSLAVKELEIAAERRLFEESLKTLNVSAARKKELLQQWELTHGLASADPFGRRVAARDRNQSHGDSMARLELELRLVGLTSTAREKALAIHDAEVRMRREGYDLGSREIELEKRRAAGIADITAELERQRDAWDKVHRAAEGMIDGPIDALLKGDVKGALASFAQEFAGLYAELAWKNPLKNRMLGTNYATLDDVGGLGGILGRMFGGGRDEAVALSGASAMSPASMAVTTPMVNISTSGLSGLPLAAGLAPAANTPWAPGGPSVAAAHLQTVATGGALRADALTGLNGPFAGQLSAMIAEAQRVFGDGAVRVTSAFRTIERQQELWAEALSRYGSAAEARRHVAPPGSSNHNFGLAADLSYGSPAVQQWMHANAARYGLGYRMGHEPWHIEPINAQAMRGQPTLPVAQLERLATTAEMATGQLGTFGTRAETTGQGLAAMGGTFAQALQMFGASKGPGGMIAATLLGGIFKGIGLPGFDRGGWTGAGGPTDVAGLVHAGEYVFDASATARIGVANLEAIRRGSMRGYQTGGYVVGGRPAVPVGQRAAVAQAVAQAPAEQRHLFEINVAGTGDAQIAAGVRAAISQAFDEYDRNVFAGRVRMVVKDDWVN